MKLEEGIRARTPFVIEQATVLWQEDLGEGFFYLTLKASEVSQRARPGQFVHMRIPGCFLKRPFSITSTDEGTLSIYYRVVGRGTRRLSSLKNGESVEVTGPLGQPFPPLHKKKWLLVAGGYGIGPLMFLMKKHNPEEALFFYGAQSKSYLKLTDELESLAMAVYTTDDGSFGMKGKVTQALEEHLQKTKGSSCVIYSCGPLPMLKAVAWLAKQYKLPCYVSMEERMGCGLGACLGCCIPVWRDHQRSYLRVCTEGPVFKSEEVFP